PPAIQSTHAAVSFASSSMARLCKKGCVMPSERDEFFPYTFARERITLEIEAVQVDGQQRDHLVKTEAATVILPVEESWQQALLSVRANLPQDQLEKILPEEERDDPPWRALLSVWCVPTRWRYPVPLQPTDEELTWSGEVPLVREHLRGT